MFTDTYFLQLSTVINTQERTARDVAVVLTRELGDSNYIAYSS